MVLNLSTSSFSSATTLSRSSTFSHLMQMEFLLSMLRSMALIQSLLTFSCCIIGGDCKSIRSCTFFPVLIRLWSIVTFELCPFLYIYNYPLIQQSFLFAGNNTQVMTKALFSPCQANRIIFNSSDFDIYNVESYLSVTFELLLSVTHLLYFRNLHLDESLCRSAFPFPFTIKVA